MRTSNVTRPIGEEKLEGEKEGSRGTSTMPIDFYYFPPSPPCRSVLLLAKAVGVHLNMKSINVLKGESMNPEFVKINPQHTIPTIDDNGFILCESRPIMEYLVSKYAKNDSLYPKDPKKRARVEERLYIDFDIYENVVMCYVVPTFFKACAISEEDVQAVERSCELLNKFLEDEEYVAGDTLTIADFAISTTISVLLSYDFDIGRYDNVEAWYNRCKELLDKFGFEEVHDPGTKLFSEVYRNHQATLQESG